MARRIKSVMLELRGLHSVVFVGCVAYGAALVACSGSASSSGGGGGSDGGASSGEGGASDGGGGDDAAGGGHVDAGSDPVVINFDDLANDSVVKDQYAAHARFSSDAGHFVTLRDDVLQGVTKEYACASDTAGVCGHSYPVYIDFTAPVRGLTFHACGVQSSGKFGQVKVTHGGTTTAVDMVNGTSDWIVVDLSQFGDVTRIEISDTDAAGIGLDEFSFLFPR